MKRILSILVASMYVISCSKEPFLNPIEDITNQSLSKKITVDDISSAVNTTAITGYTTYTIYKGQNYCTPRTLKSIKTSEMKFYAKFDKSAQYNLNNGDQYDISKLWGFSEGFDNQYNSCRIGWSYNDGGVNSSVVNDINNSQLRLYAYSYAKGVRDFKEIGIVPIDTDIQCSIKPISYSYVCSISFTTSTGTISSYSATVTRGTNKSTASGYQQYPYFGGNQVAPQDIFIKVKPI